MYNAGSGGKSPSGGYGQKKVMYREGGRERERKRRVIVRKEPLEGKKGQVSMCNCRTWLEDVKCGIGLQGEFRKRIRKKKGTR